MMTPYFQFHQKLLTKLSPLSTNPKCPSIRLSGFHGDAIPLVPILGKPALSGKTLWIVAGTIEKAHYLMQSLETFRDLFDDSFSLCFLPEEEVLPYEPESPPDFIRAERIHALSRLSREQVDVVVTTFPAIVRKTIPPSIFRKISWSLSVGETSNQEELSEALVRLGFLRVSQVSSPAEFAVRGGILDLYTPSHPEPVRLEWDDDLLSSIRTFDVNTQKSFSSLSRIDILPGVEWIPPEEKNLPDASIDWLRQHQSSPLPPGIERFSSFFYPDTCSPLDYSESPVLLIEDPSALSHKKEEWAARVREGWEGLSDQEQAFLPTPEQGFLFHPTDGFDRFESGYPSILLTSLAEDETSFLARSPESILHQDDSWLSKIPELLQRTTLLSIFRTRGQRDRFQDLLANQDILSSPIGDLSDLPVRENRSSKTVYTTIGDIGEGFYLPDDNFLVVSDGYLFRKRMEPRIHRTFSTASPVYRKDRPPLNEGEPVVHLQHGIGIYRGLREIEVGTIPGEFFVVEYRDLEKLYVPVDHADLLQPYRGPEGLTPTLDRLGGQTWNRTRSRVRKEIEKISQELVDLYAKRKTVSGFSYSTDSLMVREFENAFPYDMTPDQEEAWNAVSSDMESPVPMDRLVLGDVGFGKTEIAMRAAFKAVADGKQVAVLVPTTLLAMQHYETFRERFSGFPVKMGLISRTVTPADVRRIRKEAGLGEIDILIGTTALISKETTFRDLGLLIIDEEQRFGVGQKEKLKTRYPNLDVMTLSATPIPRTLQMSLSGLRGISFIMTPPPGRKPIKTAILPFDRHRIREAIDRELARDGQVFFIHNRVQTISRIVHYLSRLFPDVPIGMAHGQMDDSMMEDVMDRFIHRHYRILVSTAIVESGLDIPGANTILVNRADLFGISELYQIRGRVGRSGQQAYSYFLIPGDSGLTDLARKRLRTLQDNTSLGSGYQIAMRDLEIRGAGSLLGHQQTGHIALVGLDLYLEMVEEAIQTRIEPEALPVPEEPVRVDLGREFRFPEEYIEHPAQRIDFYRRLAHSKELSEILAIENEVTDRFGPLPRSAKGLFLGARLRILGSRHGFSEIKVRDRELFLKPSFFGMLTPEKIQTLSEFFEGRIWANPDLTLSLLGSPNTFCDDLQHIGNILSGVGIASQDPLT
ncbi:MAG: transcription-repair coupling factor [Leptospirales bacterium]